VAADGEVAAVGIVQLDFDGCLRAAVFDVLVDSGGTAEDGWLAGHAQTDGADYGGLACAVGADYDVEIGAWGEFERVVGPSREFKKFSLFFGSLDFRKVFSSKVLMYTKIYNLQFKKLN